MKLQKTFVLCLLLMSAASTVLGKAPAEKTAENDTLLRILREELAADFEELQQQDVKPYFMSFRVQESHNAAIAATFGYLGTSIQQHTRTFTPQIRVGTPELDNFKFDNQSNGGAQALPLTDASPDAIRTMIWSRMLHSYDRVAAAYRNVQNRLRSQADNEDKAPCFSVQSSTPAETYYEAPLPHTGLTPAEQHAWEERVCHISSVFRQWPQFNEAIVNLQVENLRTHLVNTDGASIVQNRVSYRLFIQAEVKTDDGMELPLVKSYYATALDSLPSEEVMLRDAEDMGQRLVALAAAPVADPFTGPALMSGPASGVFFHEIFGHRLEGHRMKTGGQTFRKMVGEQLLPVDFQVYCDPTLTHYGSQPLNGGFLYDDEGTRARRVNNVVDGVLKEFLMSRVPLDSFPESNGHGRTAEGRDPVSRQSNLVVETRKPYTEAQLRQMLRDEARRQGKDYGYLFQSVSGGYTQTGEGNSINSFNVNPLEVYRIYVDGRPDELVRGVDLIGTPLSMFSNIEAGGDTPSTFIGVCGAESGWVPVSATSPMIFCSKIETQRRQQKSALMPVLAAPSFTDSPPALPVREGAVTRDSEGGTASQTHSAPSLTGRAGGESSLVFQALSDELRRSMDSLRIEGLPTPFLIDYRLQRSRSLDIMAVRGEVIRKMETPWGQNLNCEVILGNHHRSSLRTPEPTSRGSSIPLALNYDNLRRAAWFATDANYKAALGTLEAKQQQQKKLTLPADEEALDDFFPAQPATSIQERSPETLDLRADELEEYVRRLSLIGTEFPELTQSDATISVKQADIYRLTSEGVRVAQPQDDLITVSFSFLRYRQANGGNATSSSDQEYSTIAELLTDSARFTKHVRDYVRRRLDLQRQPETEDYYVGPVLIEEGASKIIYNSANSNRHNFRAWHPFAQSDRAIFVKRDRKIVDDKISIRQDPTLSQWNGKPLVGYYTADADGQTPQAVTLVERGIFRGQLSGATPALGTNAPTGNLRFNNPFNWNGPLGVGTAPGVLRIESSKTMPLKKMRKQLLRDAQREGYDHAYIVQGDYAFRVSVKDGSETPVRQLVVFPTDQHMRHISALSSEQEAVTHSEDGGARFSIVGPKAMILNDIEVPPHNPEQKAKLTLTFPLHRKN
ncbi:MAG: hypothetical protein IKO85_00065 [Bacteroidaceae bacterium]|nr:hypothetical protein [Bacteroidaceae bacterium]